MGGKKKIGGPFFMPVKLRFAFVTVKAEAGTTVKPAAIKAFKRVSVSVRFNCFSG